nr:NADH dehydrogenase subunit 2 [Hecalus sp.]
MFLNSTKIILTNSMMIGVIMTICSNNWISMWMGLEMSLLSFIPIMQNTKNINSSESMMTYFIVQSVASMIFMFSVIVMLIGVNMMNEMLLMLSMLIKLGVAPFHNWVMMIIEALNYITLFNMLTLLKVPPLFIISQTNTKYLTVPIIMSMMIGSILCINQCSLRKIIGFSSIFNISLMLVLISTNLNLTYYFLMIYSSMMLMLIMTTKNLKTSFISQLSMMDFNIWLKLNMWMNMLSIMGFPPFMGFTIKLMLIQSMIMNNQMILMSTMLITSMLTMTFYTRLAFTSMLCYFSTKKWNKMLKNKSMYFLILLNFTLTPMTMTMTTVF